MRRRSFLTAAGLATLSTLTGMSTMDIQWIRPGDAGYAEAKLGYFPIYDHQRPSAIAKVTSVADVQRCVETARQTGSRIAARCGGHSYPGYSTADGAIVVDVRGLNRIQLHPDGTVDVDAGVLLMDLYLALAAAGRMLPAGTCPTVGIAGLTLGGGIGMTGRQFGLTCDRLTKLEIVTPDGVHRTVSPAQHPDLFWALRGGGGGNFGIVTRFTFRTEPARELTTFSLKFAPAALPALLHAWPQWQASAPWAMTTSFGVSGGPASSPSLNGCFVGSPQECKPLVDDLIRRIGSPPTSRRETPKTYLAAMEEYAWCSTADNSCKPGWGGGTGGQKRGEYVATSRMLFRPVADPEALAAVFRNTPNSYNMIDSVGGAIAKGPASAYPHRQAIASIQVECFLTDGEAAARRAMGAARDELGRMYGEHGYVNYLDPRMPNWQRAYYGGNLSRLQSVARRYDPDRVFAFPQGLA
ncbi:FAD-binding oxidoreductase [Crossiella sp. CA-258035]|uniref:FAD-binding oxidoreductase n=1 Tax=Crossiella sp. CA-258035 TaxID=2981138 RepID=UPI0024BC4984|nr:FAD-binding oxidoreductase [Crossiella sp. CA-258035]WHT16211.1 FAD-binding oxidoreductase [Crossiella sp. CA-258035]